MIENKACVERVFAVVIAAFSISLATVPIAEGWAGSGWYFLNLYNHHGEMTRDSLEGLGWDDVMIGKIPEYANEVEINSVLEFVPKVQERWQTFPELGTIVKMSVILVMIVIAYNSFDGIISPFIREFSWIYPLAFLGLAIMPMYTLFITLYRNTDKITDLVTAKIAETNVDKVTDLVTGKVAKLPEAIEKQKLEILSTPTSQENIGLKMQKEEEWSKERINAEMHDLMWAKYIRLGIAIPFLLSGIFGGITFLFSLGILLEYSRYGYGGAAMGEIIFTLIAIIISAIIGLYFLKSWREKSRRYNELKAKL